MKTKLLQAGTLNNLMLGDYDGSITVKEILKEANFGIGTFDSFDGEAIFLDGVAYNGRADGKIYEMKESDSCPFCQVVNFDNNLEKSMISFDSIDTLLTLIKRKIESLNYFYALKIEGRFSVSYRSCFKTTKPYQRLEILIKDQVIFNKNDIEGTIVGIYSPSFTDGLSLPGLHLHFISKDKSTGGHVLNFSGNDVKLTLNKIIDYEIRFPNSSRFKENDFTIDLKEVIRKVEG